MTRVVRHYPAIVEGDAESGYGVFFPDLPGCTSGGETIQEAALNASEALVGHLGLMLEGGAPDADGAPVTPPHADARVQGAV